MFGNIAIVSEEKWEEFTSAQRFINGRYSLFLMKIEHIEAKSNLAEADFDTSSLPVKVGVVTTVQYLADIQSVVDFLVQKGRDAVLCGQVLGCDAGAAVAHAGSVDGFLYVGTGEFHPIGVALQTGKPVFVLHPESMKVRKLDEADVEKIRKKKKGMLAKFHSASVVGVLMTTKKGQNAVQGGMDRVAALEKQHGDKRFYHFLCDTLDFSELENYPFIECWVNTMCPRMMEDIKVLNIEDLER